jgi:beta-glucanase (GH16 family)
VPPAIAGQGYSRVLDDNFDIFNAANWSLQHFWDPPVLGAVFVQNGVLHAVSRRSDGFPWVEPSTHGKRNFRYGYFEARLKWPAARGAWPAFWLSSSYHYERGTCPYRNSELDIFEGQGDEPSTYYGTLHYNTGGVCGVGDQSRPATRWHDVGNMTTGFHTYAVLWTATEVVWYFDDREIQRTTPWADSTDQLMYIIIGMEACGWDSSNACGASTPDELHTEIDWVRVWQK